MPLASTSFPIFKISASGNDFLLIDLLDHARLELWQTEWGQTTRSDLARTWCDRHEGLGADGIVFLESEKGVDFVWDFYNSDGGSAELCGNAARGVSLYMHQTHGQAQLVFKTRAGLVRARIESPQKIEVELPALALAEWDQISAKGKLAFDFIVAGVPHVIVSVPDIENLQSLRELARSLKSESRFQKDGTNVTFVQSTGPLAVRSITFERGVEDFTRACGTGAVATAFWVLRGREGEEVQVQVPGGHLAVVWKDGRPCLKGPAKIVAQMHLVRS